MSKRRMPAPLLRAFSIALAAVALYTLLGFLVAPRVARRILLKRMGAMLVTAPTLERMKCNPFALSVTVEKFSLPDLSNRSAFSFDELFVRFSPWSPFLGAWTFDEVRLSKPNVNLALLADHTLSLSHLLRPMPAAPPADSTRRPPILRMRHLEVTDGWLSYEDLSRQPQIKKALLPIHIELREFSTRRDNQNAYTFDAKSDANETLRWEGRFRLQPFTSDGTLLIGNLQARTIADFMGTALPFALTRGSFDLAAGYGFDATRGASAVELHDLRTVTHDLAVADRASGKVVIAARALATSGGRVVPGSRLADLGQVTADGLSLLVWMDATGLTNFQKWSTGPADTAGSWITNISDAKLTGASLVYQDRRLDPPAEFSVSDGAVDLRGFSTRAGNKADLTASCKVGASGSVQAKGTLMAGIPSADLDLEAAGIELKPIEPYVRAFSRVAIVKGTVGAKGHFLFNTFGPHGPMMRFTGEASSSDLAVIDLKVRKDFLRWKRVDLHGMEYDYLPSRLVIRQVAMDQPFARVVIAPDRTTNLQAVVVPPDSIPAAFRPVPGAPLDTLSTRIEEVKLTGGLLYFADLSMKPDFATGIQKLNGSVRGLSSSAAAHAEVSLDGFVDAYAPVKISGTLNPLNSHGRTDLALSFHNMELTSFTPYSGRFMGYEIAKGKLDLDLNYKIQDRQLDATNKVLMRQITLGPKVPSADATKLPVKLVIALLKDRAGNINLNLPVKGSLDDPKFSVFPIILKVLLGLVTKAVTSPFRLLGAIFSSGDDSAPAVLFHYGTAALDSTETKKLAAIRHGLSEKPGLKLEIEQAGEARRDSLALVDGHFLAALEHAAPAGGSRKPQPPELLVAAAGLAPPGLEPAEFASRLNSAYTERFGTAPAIAAAKRHRGDASPDTALIGAYRRHLAALAARLRQETLPTSNEVADLGRKRAHAVRNFLLADTSIVPDRIYIVAPRMAGGNDSTGVRLGLTLTAD